MVDYLKIKKSIEEDDVIMASIKGLNSKKDYLKLFNVLDRSLKCVLISLRLITDGMEKVVDKIDNNDSIPAGKKINSTLLISDLLKQIQDTVVAIDECDAIKESWEYTGNPNDDIEKIKLGEL